MNEKSACVRKCGACFGGLKIYGDIFSPTTCKHFMTKWLKSDGVFVFWTLWERSRTLSKSISLGMYALQMHKYRITHLSYVTAHNCSKNTSESDISHEWRDYLISVKTLPFQGKNKTQWLIKSRFLFDFI